MTDLVSGSKGEADFSIKIEDGKLKIILDYNGEQTDVKIEASSDLAKFADMLAEAIPGKLDDKVIAMLKLAMGV